MGRSRECSYICCCRIHVHNFVFAASIFDIIVSIVGIVFLVAIGMVSARTRAARWSRALVACARWQSLLDSMFLLARIICTG